jgi:hypothetical protein
MDKTNELIETHIQKMLVIPESYDPVETILDSAYAPYDSPELLALTYKVSQMGIELQNLKDKAKIAKSFMSIWEEDPYSSSFAQNEYQESKAEYEQIVEQQKEVEKRLTKAGEEMKELLQKEPEFIGYKATHRYRAKNNAGQVLIGDQFYIFNKDLTEILASYDMDSDEYIISQEVIKQISQIQ